MCQNAQVNKFVTSATRASMSKTIFGINIVLILLTYRCVYVSVWQKSARYKAQF